MIKGRTEQSSSNERLIPLTVRLRHRLPPPNSPALPAPTAEPNAMSVAATATANHFPGTTGPAPMSMPTLTGRINAAADHDHDHDPFEAGALSPINHKTSYWAGEESPPSGVAAAAASPEETAAGMQRETTNDGRTSPEGDKDTDTPPSKQGTNDLDRNDPSGADNDDNDNDDDDDDNCSSDKMIPMTAEDADTPGDDSHNKDRGGDKPQSGTIAATVNHRSNREPSNRNREPSNRNREQSKQPGTIEATRNHQTVTGTGIGIHPRERKQKAKRKHEKRHKQRLSSNFLTIAAPVSKSHETYKQL
eukprot:jgi/Psemu1/47387/gm1.47387_g